MIRSKKYEFPISVLITNYNKASYLSRSINRLLKQNYENFEIILYDDCSTDTSLEIIKKFKKIKVIRNKKKKYLNPALNQIDGVIKAFYKSKGKLLCLLDADDFFDLRKLKFVNNYFQQNNNSKVLYNFPKIFKTYFKFKNRIKNKIWPTIFPTSCITIERESFLNFIKYIRPKSFPNLEIDARLIIFFQFYYGEYNLLNKKLTQYNYDSNGITSGIKKFSKLWWSRRYQAHTYMNYIKKIKKKDINVSFDYLITKLINNFLI